MCTLEANQSAMWISDSRDVKNIISLKSPPPTFASSTTNNQIFQVAYHVEMHTLTIMRRFRPRN